MRQINVEKANLESCVSRAQQERLVITRKGKPVALLVGVRPVAHAVFARDFGGVAIL